MKQIELTEYGTSDPIRLSSADRARLWSAGRGRIEILADPDPEWVRLRASSYVGTMVLVDSTIWVQPKAKPDNLFRLLYVGLPADAWSSNSVAYAEATDFVEGIAETVLRVMHEATARGLVHGYRSTEERVQVIRGRLRVEQLARTPWDQVPAPCRFDDFTADVWENQTLRAAVRLVRSWPRLGFASRRECDRLLERLAEVSDQSAAGLLGQLPVFTRVNEHYRHAIGLARLLLRGAAFTEQRGSIQAQGFMFDMNALFERWVSEELCRRLQPGISVETQDPTHLDVGRRVPIRPDLVFHRKGNVHIVGDVKYKLTGSGVARSSDYFQLLAYCTTYGVRSGVLVYCTADQAPESRVVIRKSGHELHCIALPLHDGGAAVDRRLDAIAELVQSSR